MSTGSDPSRAADAGADQVLIHPFTGPLDTVVDLPGSKSETNRVLVCAALAHGTSTVERVLVADDTEAMVEALRSLGIGLEATAGGTEYSIEGTGGEVPPGPATVGVRMSGTTARFIVPLLACGSGEYTVTADPSMAVRPMAPLFDALDTLGAGEVRPLGAPGHLPAVIVGRGRRGGTVALPGDTSSQFLSGLMLSAPIRRGGLTVELTTELVSRPYVEMTAAVMGAFGASVELDQVGGGRVVIRVAEGQYRARPYRIEPDASAASYLLALPALVGGRVTVPGLGRRSLQGDVAFVELLAAMGAEVHIGADDTTVVGTGRLRGIDADLSDISDTAQTLAAVAAFAEGPTRLRGIGFIRAKETDRIGAMVTELRRCGIDAVETDDGFEVYPTPEGPPSTPVTVQTYRDHRMAMSLALVGLRRGGVTIADPGCVAKTFPGFWQVLESVGAHLEPAATPRVASPRTDPQVGRQQPPT